jgi:hypothetical protein
MKKMILGGIAVIVIAVLAAVNVNMNSQSENLLSDFALANVEALANGETGSGGGSGCGFAAYEYNNNWYEDTKTFRRCGECVWVSGTSPQYTNC